METNLLPASTFVAIDVEWATRDHQICQIGLAVVQNLEITERLQWLIQPPGNKYDDTLLLNHHINPEMTANAPTLPEVWPEILPYLKIGELWAHNAVSAETPAFRKSLDTYGISFDEFHINDSIEIFCRPDCNGGNGLEQCCMAMSIPFDESEHHDALYDAEKLAELLIALRQGRDPDWTDVPVSTEQLRKSRQEKRILRMGEFAEYEKQQKSGAADDTGSGDIDLFAELASTYAGAQPQVVDVFDKGDRMQKEGDDLIDIARLDTSENNPLWGRVVAMTGAFHFSRKEIDRALTAMDATTDGMTGKTNILLVGNRNVGLPKLAKYEKQTAKHPVALCVGDDDLDALLYGDGTKFFGE